MKNIKIIFEMLKQVNYILDKKTKKASIFVFVNILIAAVLETIGVSAIIPFIQAMITPDVIMNNKYIAVFIESFHITSNVGLLIMLAIFVILVYFIKNIYLIFSSMIQVRFQTNLQKKLATDMLKSYLKRPYTYFIEVNSADMMRGISSDITGVYRMVDNIFKILAEIITVTFIGIFIFVADPIMAIGLLLVATLCVVIITLTIKKKLNIVGKKHRDTCALVNKYAYQSFNGIKEISVMNRRDLFTQKYEDAYDELRKADFYLNVALASPKRIIEVVFITAVILLVCIKMWYGVNAIEYIPMLASLAVAGIRILPSISAVSNYITNTIFLRHSLAGAYENFYAARTYEQTHCTDKKVLLENKGEKINFEKISIDNITWEYENSKKEVIKNLSLTINRGEAIALIGESGAGKTTLADIILGLLKPQTGKITLDEDKNIFEIPNVWSEMVGYVPQMVFLLDDTIRNNILFGIENGDDKKVWEALEKAQLADYVRKLPQGIDTIVGERGVKISGGQRQRIAIARALYYDPCILVMDEATSALDNETETAVMEAIDELQGEKTIIIVAHRLTTIRNCDRIFEICNGIAIERSKMEIIG
ncbi:MAG: ABC transporter ATP-binding protein [Candidatus Absconditabacteria bacterium]|nr:ABC transporter ATP-binding protein [Candidatus Absconditabacteria bacterium]